ncbi:GTP-binding protein [Paenibacillus glycanilyticus]|uniref:GTP-binding protein n=1 Tax=Paenibacillus glycanilyticus TaxID=126569 RepID=UPI0032E9BFC7
MRIRFLNNETYRLSTDRARWNQATFRWTDLGKGCCCCRITWAMQRHMRLQRAVGYSLWHIALRIDRVAILGQALDDCAGR